MTLCTPQNKFIKFTILQIFPFTSETKRMGIIVRVRTSDYRQKTKCFQRFWGEDDALLAVLCSVAKIRYCFRMDLSFAKALGNSQNGLGNIFCPKCFEGEKCFWTSILLMSVSLSNLVVLT